MENGGWRMKDGWSHLHEHLELPDYACKWQAHGRLSGDPTIGTWWDASCRLPIYYRLTKLEHT